MTDDKLRAALDVRGYSGPGEDDPLRDFLATYFDHDDEVTRGMVLDYLDRIVRVAASDAVADATRRLVIAFRRFCVEEFESAPTEDDFRGILALAASATDEGPHYERFGDAYVARPAAPVALDEVYAAVRPEFRDDAPGYAGVGDSDNRARATAERIHARLAASATDEGPLPAGHPDTWPGGTMHLRPATDPLRLAAVSVCRLWFTYNAPADSQHVRKAMLALRAALQEQPE